MTKKKPFKSGLTIVIAGIVLGIGIAIILFNMPHRNIQNSDADYSLTVNDLVTEYLNDSQSANNKYLSEDGDSKILEVSGTIKHVRRNLRDQIVITLESMNTPAGVNATLDATIDVNIKELTIGKNISIKGVIRSGATYDSDMELYQNAIIDKGIILL